MGAIQLHILQLHMIGPRQCTQLLQTPVGAHYLEINLEQYMKSKDVDEAIMSLMADGITRSAAQITKQAGFVDADKPVRNSISRLVKAGKLVHMRDGRIHTYKLPPTGNTTNPFEWKTYKSPWS